MRPTVCGVALALVLLSGCTSGPTPTASDATPTPSTPASRPGAERTPVEVASELLAPLSAFPACTATPTPVEDGADVDGLVLPADAVITQVDETGPLTQVQGYVEHTPIQVRVDYQGRTDIELLNVEDEIFESEVLFERDGRRVFFKTQAVCDLGSVFVAIVADAEDAGAVPVPSGGAASPPDTAP